MTDCVANAAWNAMLYINQNTDSLPIKDRAEFVEYVLKNTGNRDVLDATRPNSDLIPILKGYGFDVKESKAYRANHELSKDEVVRTFLNLLVD
jgi:hypothetical protein